MIQYDSREHRHDLLLLQWYHHVAVSGDIHKIFHIPPTVGELYRIFGPPTEAVFEEDAAGIWYLAWLDPCFSGAFLSVWAREDKRATRALLEVYERTIDSAFLTYSNLLGITKQPALLPIHRKFGYNILCEIPNFYGGETGYFMLLTQENWNGRKRITRKRVKS